MKARILTTAPNEGTAIQIAGEMTEKTGNPFNFMNVSMIDASFWRIEGMISDEDFISMPALEDEFIFINPSNEWVFKFGKYLRSEYSRTIKGVPFYWNTFEFAGDTYQLLVSGEGTEQEVEDPEYNAYHIK